MIPVTAQPANQIAMTIFIYGNFDLFVIVLTVILLKGTLVPFIVAAPKYQVVSPSETVLDSAGGGGCD